MTASAKCGGDLTPDVDGKVHYVPCDMEPADEVGKQFVCKNCGHVFVFVRYHREERG